MHIERADLGDAGEILALIKRAFTPVAEHYGDPDLPPLVETLEQHRTVYAHGIVLKAIENGRIIGSVQGIPEADGVCYVARLVVDPASQGQGIGRALAAELESHFPDARCFSLFTGDRSDASIALYRSLGYDETRREFVHERLTLVWMEKRR